MPRRARVIVPGMPHHVYCETGLLTLHEYINGVAAGVESGGLQLLPIDQSSPLDCENRRQPR